MHYGHIGISEEEEEYFNSKIEQHYVNKKSESSPISKSKHLSTYQPRRHVPKVVKIAKTPNIAAHLD